MRWLISRSVIGWSLTTATMPWLSAKAGNAGTAMASPAQTAIRNKSLIITFRS